MFLKSWEVVQQLQAPGEREDAHNMRFHETYDFWYYQSKLYTESIDIVSVEDVTFE